MSLWAVDNAKGTLIESSGSRVCWNERLQETGKASRAFAAREVVP
jgi:hypothetical protein